MSGPIPVSPSSARPRGMFTWLKNGGPTVTFVPWTSSERIGKSVPHSTENAMPTNKRLLNRKLASRLTIDSSLASASSSSSRLAYTAKLAVAAAIRKKRKKYPTFDWVNECTLEMTPERVMNVPKIESSHDPMMSARFHFLSIPRFSWIITECREAVIVSHGKSDAFSTGSQSQYPPHPRSTYAHHIPSQIPTDRNSQESSVHLRMATSQSTSRRCDSSAAIANANGIVIEMYPR